LIPPYTAVPRLHTLLFSSHTSPPPISTLFPYTTLFRSVGPIGPAQRRVDRAIHRHGLGKPLRAQADAAVHRISLHVERRHPPEQDRKSTRLNSSHVSISYAVFCLKKKTATKVIN